MTGVNPEVLVSLLPFGVAKINTGKEKMIFRFSVSIDIKSVYPNDDKPLYKPLLSMIQSFGLGKEQSGFHLLKKNLGISINGGKSVPATPSFKDLVNEDNVDSYWRKIGVDTVTAQTTSTEEGDFKPNLVASLGLTALYNGMANPDKLREKAVSSYRQALTVGKADVLLDEMKKEFGVLKNDIDLLDAHLKASHDFAAAHNGVQSAFLFGKKVPTAAGIRSAMDGHNTIIDSTESIMATFGFINSNTILQRLFGITIDFDIEITDDLLAQMANGRPFIISFPNNTFDNFCPGIKWIYLSTEVKRITPTNNRQIIVVNQRSSLQALQQRLYGRNYDVGSKLQSMKALEDKIKGFHAELGLAENDGPESRRLELISELLKLDSAAFTRGMNVYNEHILDALDAERQSGNPDTNSGTIYLKDIIKGYRVAIVKAGDRAKSLGSRRASLKGMTLPPELELQDFALHTDTGTHALTDQNGKIEHRLLIDSAVLTWSGENLGLPSIFSNVEDDTNFNSTVDEGSVSDAHRMVSEAFGKVFFQSYKLTGVQYDDSVSSSFVNISVNDYQELKPIRLQYEPRQNEKLVFGRQYRLILVPEYKNGWAVPFDDNGLMPGIMAFRNAGIPDISHQLHEVESFTFRRNEPVKPVAFYGTEPLLDRNTNQPAAGREGESLYHLVIRNFAKGWEDFNTTSQRSARFILPPSISFEHAFWYNKIFEMNADQSYEWYKKYHFPVIENKKGVLKDRISEDEAIKGSIRMQDYYTDSCAINYLPDPLCKGFRLEFYLDGKRSIKAPDYTSYEQHEYYFSGTYPRINAWKLILRDIDYDEPLVSYKKEQLTIRIEKGRELFLKVRTILDTMYEKQLETYGNYNEYTQFGGNDLLTPPLEISLVHAMQRPLVIPRLDNTLTCHKQQDKTQIELINAIQAEQLGLHPDAAGIAGYLPSFMPTGSVELYAKWEEFVDDPRHLASGDWTPYQPVNEVDLTRFSFKNGASPATFEAAMNIGSHLEEMKKTLVKTGSELNEAQNYTVNMWANYDSRDTRFLEKWIWVLNKSVFHSYYPAAWNAPAEIITETTDRFSRISAQPFLIRYLNSKKPAVPVLAAKNITLVSVTDDWEDGKSFKRKASLNRLRFYFDRGRLTSGKGERLGFVLNEPSSAYNDYLVANNLVSVAGSDIISDSAKLYDGLYRHKGVLLNKSHFNVRDPYDLRNDDDDKGKDLEAYQPDYIPELGLITFLPKFDAALNLWVLDVELDLNDKNGGELHSPFVQMAIVNYQEYSHNYNDPGEAPDIAKDYRISAINKSSYVYIMGSRTIAVTPLSNKIRVSVELDLSSIKGLPQNDLSKFYGIVQHKKSGTVQWVAADGKVAGDAAAFSKLSFSTGLTAEIGYVNYSHTDYRFLLLETEDWGNSNDDKLDNVIHNKNSRIVLISLFDL